MRDGKYNDFRDLEVWQKCKEIWQEIFELCKKFPSEEKYRLVDQMIRSSRSAPACIAERYGRFHFKENIQLCRHARGSLYELIEHLDVALDCKYIDNVTSEYFIDKVKTAIQVLNGYIKYLKSRVE